LFVPECSEFERISKFWIEKVEKAITYLKWKKEKFRLMKCNNISSVEISELFCDSKIRYGIQVKFNSFLIWKYTVRWNIYAEITLLNGRVTFGYLRKKKEEKIRDTV
jgi:hypothetical protein